MKFMSLEKSSQHGEDHGFHQHNGMMAVSTEIPPAEYKQIRKKNMGSTSII
jgi:hypothetical protein